MTELLEILESRVPKGSVGNRTVALDHQETKAVRETLDLQDVLDQTENGDHLDSQDLQDLQVAATAKEIWASRGLQECPE